MATLVLTLLGGFQARAGSGEPIDLTAKKVKALLAYLALAPGRMHPRSHVAELLWGEAGHPQARNSLRQALAVLRRALWAERMDVLVEAPGEVGLDGRLIDVDLARFGEFLSAGGAKALASALDLYRGDLLTGLVSGAAGFDEWLAVERQRVRDRALAAFDTLLEDRIRTSPAEAFDTARRLLALDAVRESAHRALLRLHAGEGRLGDAIRQYQTCVVVLRRELSVEPSTPTRRLYQELLERQRMPPGAKGSHGRLPAETCGANGRLPSRETPLVGRSAELSAMGAALTAAMEGRGRVVAVLGEAGIGKSRLVAELTDQGATRGARVLVGRCREAEQVLPLRPWVEALRGGLQDADLRALPRPVRADLARVLPELGDASTVPDDRHDPMRAIDATATLLRGMAAPRPLVVVIEDLQWADDTSVRLLSYLCRGLREVALLVAVTIRSEELHDLPALGRLLGGLAREDLLVRLSLAALSREETLRLVRAIAGPASSGDATRWVEQRAWELSRGHPFMAVEAVRAAEQGVRLDTLPDVVPERVRELVAGRLARLGERSRQLAAVAAVIGAPFEFALLQGAGGLPESETAVAVEELSRRHVLGAVENFLDFTHERIREIAYAQILPPVRKALHASVARAIEIVHADRLESHSARLGRHYRESEAWERAVHAFADAGHTAAARAAHQEAVECLEQALAALEHLPDGGPRQHLAVDLRFDLRNSLVPLGAVDRVVRRLDEAEAIARAAGDGPRLGWVASYRAFQSTLAGRYRSAVESAREALAAAEAAGDGKLRVHAGYTLAVSAYSLGAYREAITTARATIATLSDAEVGARVGGATVPAVLCRSYLALSLAEVGELAEALAVADAAIAIAQRVDHRYSEAAARYAAGLVLAARGETARAVEVFERGLGIARAGEFHLFESFLAAGLGITFVRSGRLADGTTLLEQAVQQAAPRGLALWAELHELWLAEAHLAAGDPRGADKHALRALEVARERGARGVEAAALRFLGMIAATQRATAAARRLVHESLVLAEALGMLPLAATCRSELQGAARGPGRR